MKIRSWYDKKSYICSRMTKEGIALRSLFFINRFLVIENYIKELLEKKLNEAEYEAYFLVRVSYNPKNKMIKVYLDGDEGISFGTCKKISRYLEEYLDERPDLDGKYTLEVSSPGTSNPLILQRQFPKHIGREFKIETLDGMKFKGTLTGVEGDDFTFEVTEKVKEGKKKKTIIKEEKIEFGTIKEALISIKFKN